MIKTRWSGGASGLEQMPSGYSTMYYTQFFGVPPIIMDFDGEKRSDAYFTGSNTKFHELETGFRTSPSTLRVNMDGVDQTIIVEDAQAGRFRIDSDDPGYVLCWYYPYADSIYFSNTPAGTYVTPAKARLVPFQKEHIDEILGALNGICDQIQVPRRNYSIESYTSNIIKYNQALGENVPMVQHLFKEIREHILYLANYVVNSPAIAATITVPDIVEYTFDNISAAIIETFRSEINIIEGAI